MVLITIEEIVFDSSKEDMHEDVSINDEFIIQRL
jgi:hypothetical protein